MCIQLSDPANAALRAQLAAREAGDLRISWGNSGEEVPEMVALGVRNIKGKGQMHTWMACVGDWVNGLKQKQEQEAELLRAPRRSKSFGAPGKMRHVLDSTIVLPKIEAQVSNGTCPSIGDKETTHRTRRAPREQKAYLPGAPRKVKVFASSRTARDEKGSISTGAVPDTRGAGSSSSSTGRSTTLRLARTSRKHRSLTSNGGAAGRGELVQAACHTC